MYKVLIIDDVSLVRDAVKLLGQWEAFGITSIFEACNAQEGLDIIYRERPELIITDMKMPIMDGTALLKKLEEKPIRSKIIVISGFSDFKYTRLAIQSGVVDYILKPIDPQDLNNAIANAMAEIEKELPPSDTPTDETPPTGNPLVNDVLDCIHENYTKELSLPVLADAFHISKEHLSRLFKKEMGTNLFTYIMDMKIAEAKNLLVNTEMTLDDIAFHLGFSNGNYFSKALKKIVGQTPREYRVNR
ncbi:MAG: response regulator [Dorea sp.]|nr:response regulator [Dorea sp.]